MDFPIRQPQNALMISDPAAIAAAESVKARIQSAYIMAIQSPRNEAQARNRILMACQRTEFARQAEFSKPMGKQQDNTGKWVQQHVNGPSIRFAELALREWGNIISEAQSLYEDEDVKRVRVSILDLETNAQFSRDISIRKTVERKSKKGREDDIIAERSNSYGSTVYILRATDEELYTKEAAWVSKIIRNEGLRLIPTDIIEEGINAARETLSKNFKQDPLAEQKKILDAFASIGVQPVDVEKHLLKGQPIATISPAQVVELRNIYTSIKEGTPWTDFINQSDPNENGGGTAQADTSAFDGLLAGKTYDIAMFNTFLEETAKANGTSVDQLKQAAATSFDRFWSSYEAYVTRNKKPVLDEELLNQVNAAFEIDPISAKTILIEIGTDNKDALSQEQAEKFLMRFDELKA